MFQFFTYPLPQVWQQAVRSSAANSAFTLPLDWIQIRSVAASTQPKACQVKYTGIALTRNVSILSVISCRDIEDIFWIQWNIDFYSLVSTENDIFVMITSKLKSVFHQIQQISFYSMLTNDYFCIFKIPDNIIPRWAPQNVITCMFKGRISVCFYKHYMQSSFPWWGANNGETKDI